MPRTPPAPDRSAGVPPQEDAGGKVADCPIGIVRSGLSDPARRSWLRARSGRHGLPQAEAGPGSPSGPQAEAGPGSPSGPLAETGTDSPSGSLGLASALVLLGATMVVFSRRLLHLRRR